MNRGAIWDAHVSPIQNQRGDISSSELFVGAQKRFREIRKRDAIKLMCSSHAKRSCFDIPRQCMTFGIEAVVTLVCPLATLRTLGTENAKPRQLSLAGAGIVVDQAALFLIAPIMAVRIAPPAPPAIAWEIIPPTLILPD